MATKTQSKPAKQESKAVPKAAPQAKSVSQKKAIFAKPAKKIKSNVLDAHVVIKFPLSTEKGIRMMESENKLLFVVDQRASKKDVKDAVEKLYASKVVGVNTFIMYGQKRAYVRFDKSTPAINVATNLGLI